MTMPALIHIVLRSPRIAMMLAGVMLIYLLAWQFGIKKTVSLLSRYEAVNCSAKNPQEQIVRPEELLSRLENLDRLMGCSNLTGDDIRQAILERLSLTGKNHPFTMVDIPEEYVYEKQRYTVTVNTFVVAGGYPALLRLMYSMDTCQAPGQVITSRIYLHKAYQSAVPELRLALYFQHIKKKHETH
jgi:hypothetical protein